MKKNIILIGMFFLTLASKVFAFDANSEYFKNHTSDEQINSIGDGGSSCMATAKYFETDRKVEEIRNEINNMSVNERELIREKIIRLLDEAN